MKKKLGLLLVMSGALLVAPMVSSVNSGYVVKAEGNTTSEVVEVKEETTPTNVNDFEEWLKNFLSPSNIALFVTILGYIGTFIGLVANIKKLKKEKNITAEQVRDCVIDCLNEDLKKEIKPALEEVNKSAKTMKEVLEVFAKILALSQDDSTETKLAILELIKQLGMCGVDTEKVEKVVKESAKALEETTQKIEKGVDDIIAATEVKKEDGTQI